MKPTIDYYVEQLANSVTPRKWIVFTLLVTAPVLFTGINRYFTGKDFFTNIGDYVEIAFETVVLAGIGLYLLRIIAQRSEIIRTLQESETRYRQLFEISPDPMIVHRQGKILLANEAAALAVGVKGPQDIAGKSVFDFIPSWHHELARKRFDLVEAQHSAAPLIEMSFIRSNGASGYGEALAVPTTFKGQPAVLSVARDITERKHAEAALKESEQKYRLLVENANDIIYLTDPNGFFLIFNSVGLRVTGYSRDEIVHKHYLELIHPEYKKEVERFYGAQFVKKIPDTYYEVPIITKQGETVWIGQKVQLVTEGDTVVGFQAICRDITDRKLAEEALRESEERYRAVFNNAAVGINLSDRDGKYLQINSTSAKMLGYTQEELQGLAFSDVTHPEDVDGSRKQLLALLDGKQDSYRLEKRYLRKDGGVVWVDVSVSAIRDARGEYMNTLSVVVDITARKRSEQERESLREQLLHAQKMEAIGTLTGGIAHEFNNLLTVVSGYTELLLTDKGPQDPTSSDLRKIAAACRRGAELIQKLRIFGRKAEYEFRPMNLNHEVKDAVKLLSNAISKVIEIQCDLADDLGAVRGDSAQIGQLIINLALNGQDAMPEGGKLLIETRKVTLGEEYCSSHVGTKPGEYVLLTVADTGHGMDETTSRRIFEPFFTTRGLAQRSGLGLAVAHGIVEKHGGHIDCESKPGIGTTFKIYLPVLHIEVEQRDAVPETIIRAGTETILLVDDEELITDLGKRILARAGYTVLVASNGKDAEDLYKVNKGRISLVILDLVMPGMGGKQCLQALLRIDPLVKVLIASGYTEKARKEELMAHGARGFVTKPFTVTQLLGDVRDILDAA